MKFKKLFFITFIALIFISSCKKDSPAAPTTYPIQGLWIGTYTITTGTYYFSFSISPDGTLTYESKDGNNEIHFADGTWSLNGSAFSFSVTTVNAPGAQFIQIGTAGYSSSKGTLTNGVGDNQTGGNPFTWTMTRIN